MSLQSEFKELVEIAREYEKILKEEKVQNRCPQGQRNLKEKEIEYEDPEF